MAMLNTQMVSFWCHTVPSLGMATLWPSQKQLAVLPVTCAAPRQAMWLMNGMKVADPGGFSAPEMIHFRR